MFFEENKEGLVYLRSDLIPLKHVFTTRYGGVSTGHLRSLNLIDKHGDSPDNIRENFGRVAALLGAGVDDCAVTKQVHGNTVRIVTEDDRHVCLARVPYEADGLVTATPGLPIFCFTADCVPILLCDAGAGVIGAVHCGWRSSVADILKNAVTAMEALGAKPEHIRSAAESFQGVRRRLDVHVNRPGLTYIDDYAHHPAELATAISSLKQIFPNRTLTGVFQPHLYTRTRDLAIGFATSLSLLDELILLDIYPAREEPIEGVTSDIIFKDVTCPVKRMMHKEDLLDYLASRDLDVLATFGAGDIDRLVQPITEMLEQR